MFEFDEFAAGAPAWYKDATKALQENDVDQARELANNALSKSREAAGCLAMANVCLAINDTAQAKQLAEEAQDKAKKEKGDKAKVAGAAAAHILAKILARSGKLGEAEKALEAPTKAYTDAKDEAGKASVLSTLSRCKKDIDEALDAANEAISIFKKLKNTRGTAAAMFALMNVKLSFSHTDHAVSVAEEIVNHFEQEKDDDGVAAARLMQVQVFMSLKRAQDAFAPALAATKTYKDSKRKARAAIQMANVLRTINLFDDAHKSADAALTLSRDAGDKRGQAAALCMAATICDSQGDHGKAAYKLERAAKLYKQLKDQKEEAQTLEAVASMQIKVINMIDDPKEPEKLCRKALSLYKSLGMENSPESGYLTQTLAYCMFAQSKVEDAIANLTASIEMFQAISNAKGEAIGCNKLGQLFWVISMHEEAVKNVQRGAKLAKECGDKEEEDLAKKLVREYTGAGEKEAEEKRTQDEAKQKKLKRLATSHIDSKHNVWMYTGGVDYFIVFEGTWRGAPAAGAAGARGRKSSSIEEAPQDAYQPMPEISMQSAEQVYESVVQIDWQSLAQV